VMKKKQQGVALIIGLVFLGAVSIVGIAVMQNTQISYQLSANQAYSEKAFQSSESARSSLGQSIADYVYDRAWVSVPSHLTVLDKDSNDGPDSPLDDNGSGENLYSQDTLAVDMEFNWASGDEKLDADIYVVKTQRMIQGGAGAQQLSGYEGFGKAAAAGGGALFFEIRSKGTSNRGATSLTASEYRAVIQ